MARNISNESTTIFQWTVDDDFNLDAFEQWAESGYARRYTVGTREWGGYGRRGHRHIAIQLWQPTTGKALHTRFGGHFRGHSGTDWDNTVKYATKWGTDYSWESSRQWRHMSGADDMQRHYESLREDSRWGCDEPDTGVRETGERDAVPVESAQHELPSNILERI